MDRYRLSLVTGHLAPITEDLGPWVKVGGLDLKQPTYVCLGQVDGQLAATCVVLGGDPDRSITARSMRIPLAKILDQIADHVRHRPTFDDPLRQAVSDIVHDEIGKAPEVVPRTRPGAAGWPDEHFEEVARRYRQAAINHPRSPTKSLHEEHYPDWTDSTVRYWLRVCRDRGLLRRSERGKAGEAGGS